MEWLIVGVVDLQQSALSPPGRGWGGLHQHKHQVKHDRATLQLDRYINYRRSTNPSREGKKRFHEPRQVLCLRMNLHRRILPSCNPAIPVQTKAGHPFSGEIPASGAASECACSLVFACARMTRKMETKSIPTPY